MKYLSKYQLRIPYCHSIITTIKWIAFWLWFQIAPPSVSWNISPSMGQAYKCREADIVQIPRYCLNVVSKLGGSHLGEVAICESLDVRITDNGRVAAKTCNADSTREVKFLCSLLDPNLVRVFGVCANESPPWLITEYPAELGDLVIVLRTHSTLTWAQYCYNKNINYIMFT